MFIKVILIFFLILILITPYHSEGFQSPEVINERAHNIYDNKVLFEPYTSYSKIKKKIPWIDPVVYNDVFSLSREKKLSISNIKDVLYM
jgi:hypothetical protein